jgi:hypothetical protein
MGTQQTAAMMKILYAEYAKMCQPLTIVSLIQFTSETQPRRVKDSINDFLKNQILKNCKKREAIDG